MDFNEYVAATMARQRRAEMEVEAVRRRLLAAAAGRRDPHPLRLALGRALMRAGERLLGRPRAGGRPAADGPGGTVPGRAPELTGAAAR